MLDYQPEQSSPSGGYVRWIICGLLFSAITINYIDRQIIGVLKPILEKQFGWDQITYSNIVFSFQLAYAIGLLVVGGLIDRIGVRWGLLLAVIFWSLAAVGHGFAAWVPLAYATTFFIVMRFILGLAEAGAFPGCIRATADWFPNKERSFAIGLFNSGASIGAIVTPLLVPVIVYYMDWPEAFFITGGLGIFWILIWLFFYKSPELHPRLSQAELNYIRSDPADPPVNVPWVKILPHRSTWAYAIGKFLTDPIWWLYLFWVPDFLNKQFKLDLKSFGIHLVVIYVMADIGSILGGWFSSFLIKRGCSVNFSRKLTMLICALAVTPIIFASKASNPWIASMLIGLAAGAHQAWSCNLYSIVSDTMPRKVVSSVIGFGGMAGAVGGMQMSKVVGYILDKTNNNYFIPFLIGAIAYLFAWCVIQILCPKLKPARFEDIETRGFEVQTPQK